MDNKITVLIPAYNASKTIERCLDSLVDQTFKNFNVIVIDDGSSDNSYDIILQYKNKLDSLVAVRQENVGVGETRQRLIKLADTEYIMFLDSDDFLEVNAVECVYSSLENDVDLFVFGYRIIREDFSKTVIKRENIQGVLPKWTISKHHINGYSDLYWSALWNKCYRKSLVVNTPPIMFQKLMEDVTFNIEYFGRCRTIKFIPMVIINYVQIGESLTRSKRKDTVNDVLDAFKLYHNLLEISLQAYPTFQHDICCKMLEYFVNLYFRANSINLQSFAKGELRHTITVLCRSIGVKSIWIRFTIFIKRLIKKYRVYLRL